MINMKSDIPVVAWLHQKVATACKVGIVLFTLQIEARNSV